MPEAMLCTTGRPDNAGCPLRESTYTWKPVYAGGLILCSREFQTRGQSFEKFDVRDMDAGDFRIP